MGYFLVARDMTSNDFQILELKSRWYLKNGNEYLSRSNKLEAIDLVTTRFSTREEMANRLVEGKYIPNNNYDFFIVSKHKNKGVEKLKFQEVIYNKKDSRTQDFRTIAYNSLNGNIKCEENVKLLYKFITKTEYSNVYARIVNDRLTGIPYSFIRDYRKIKNSNMNPYALKYKSAKCLQNYGLSRSIVDSLNRFDDLKDKDTYKNHILYFKKLTDGRMKIYKELLELCDKNYVVGQLSIFDIANKEPDTIEKKIFVMKSLKNIGLSRFIIYNGKKSIRIDDFLKYINNEEAKILNKGLNTRVLNAAYLYNLHTSKLNSYGQSAANFELFQKDINEDLVDLKKSLDNDKTIDKAYKYCKCFSDALKRSLGGGVESYQKRRN